MLRRPSARACIVSCCNNDDDRDSDEEIMIDGGLAMTSVASEVKATKKSFSPFSVDSLLSHREKVINNNAAAAAANGIPRAVVLPQKQEAGGDEDRAADGDEKSDLKNEEQTSRGESEVYFKWGKNLLSQLILSSDNIPAC